MTQAQVRAATVSVAAQLAARVLHLALNVVSTLAIVRYLAPDLYGVYTLVLTVTTLAGTVADFGLPKLAVRETVRAGADEDGVTGTVIALRLGLAVLAIAACQGVLAALGAPAQAHLAGAVAGLMILVEAVLGVVVVAFQTRLVQQYEAFVRVLAEALETGLVLTLVAVGASLPWLFVPPTVGLTVGLAVAWWLTRRRYGLRPRLVPATVRPLLVEALTIGPALLVGVLYLKLDSLVVAALRPSADLGLYGAAYQPVEYLFLASAVLINVLFPLVAGAWGAGERGRFEALYRRGTELLVLATGLVTAVTVSLAPGLVRTAFGADYAGAAAPLAILSVALVAMSVNAWQALVLMAGGFQKVVLWYNLVALGVSLVASATLVHLVGPSGAALAALLTAGFVLVASTRAVRRHMTTTLDGRRLAQVALVATPSAAVCAVLTWLGVPWVPAALVATVCYLAIAGRLRFASTIRAAIA